MLSNTGNRPAGLSQVEIESPGKSGSVSWYLQNEPDVKLLEPGKAYILTASNGTSIPAAVPHEVAAILKGTSEDKPNCRFVVKYIQLSGAKEYLYTPFYCLPIEPTVFKPSPKQAP
jgi:hypothetical protein